MLVDPVLVHASLMSLVTFVLLPLGVLIARYHLSTSKLLKIIGITVKSDEPEAIGRQAWLRPHSVVLFFSGFFLLIGWITMLLTVRTHMATVHSWIGLAVVLLTVFVQPDYGALDHDSVRRPNHRRLGYGIFTACVINSLLGYAMLYGW